MGWADALRTMRVRANADTPHDAQTARAFGAEGIGLCRTEHMFFGEDRIAAVREMILSDAAEERAGIRSVSLIGHSMGGAIALELGRRRPELTGALVLVAPAVSGRLRFLRTLLDSPFRQLLLSLSQPHTALALWSERTMLGASEFIRNPALRRDLQDLAHTTPEAFIGGLNAVLDFDFTDHLRVISAPTLVVVGTRDMTLPSSESELAASQIPGARLVKMRGVGHQPIDERPEEFDRLLVEFLKDNLMTL
jgi:pimeloyl-ACP methyl ester carboxylesterase